MASASETLWNCPRCTFQQSSFNKECEICGEKNNIKNNQKSIVEVENNIQKQYGNIIYQCDRFTEDQLSTTYALYLHNPNIQTSSWPIYLFGDNDMDNSRPSNADREMIGGLAGVCGRYDRNIAFGIVTTFYFHVPMPDFSKFKKLLSTQFDELWNKYIIHGHDVIIPSPNDHDLKQHHSSFYEQMNNDEDHPQFQQVIFHNIGTGIARLPLLYLKYIQYKIDDIARLSAKHNQGISIPLQIESDNKQKAIEHKNNNGALQDANDVIMIEEKKNDSNEPIKVNVSEIDYSPNDIIEVCVNPAIDVWIEGTFLGYSNKNKCFVEIIKKNAENAFMETDVKYIRFKVNEFEQEEKKMEIDDNHHRQHSNNNNSNKTDEWETVSDFVLKEYIIDVFEELSADLLNSLDEFMRRMEFLGVNSAKSRSRALSILEEMKNTRESQKLAQELQAKENKANDQYKQRVSAQNDEFIAAEIAQRLADGHTLESFKCIRCHQQQEHGGIELRNCTHKICYKCLPQLVSSHIAMKMMPSCIKCGSAIHQTDIKIHVNAHTAEIVGDIQIKDMMAKQKDLHYCFAKQCNGCIIIEDKYMKEFKCPVCNKRNCIKCKKIHLGNEQCYVPPPPIIAYKPPNYFSHHHHRKHNKLSDHGNYHISNEEFIGNWVNVMDIQTSNMCQSFDVPLNSDEWNKVILHIRDPTKRKVERIERIQNAKVWKAYWSYYNKHRQAKVGGFWHGTRTHKPSVIWKHDGFLKEKSRIGNCLWYATENTYSMNGFQHVMSNGKHQVFLAFVCCGNNSDVKFIRQNKILNVYKNAATYPAYLLTYKNV